MTGLQIFTSNRMEVLIEQLADRVCKPPASPLAPEIIVVQSRGMERYITMELARRNGICANVEFPFPNAFLESVFRSLSDTPGGLSAFDPHVLAFRIMAQAADKSQLNLFLYSISTRFNSLPEMNAAAAIVHQHGGTTLALRLAKAAGQRNIDIDSYSYTSASGANNRTNEFLMDGIPNNVSDRVAYIPSPDHLSRCWEQYRRGQVPDDPTSYMYMPSVLDPSLAPAGHYTCTFFSHYFPYAIAPEKHNELKQVMADAKGDPIEMQARIVVACAMNEKGERIWQRLDYSELMREYDPAIVARIANLIMAEAKLDVPASEGN
mgnify:CR=1 FL=1